MNAEIIAIGSELLLGQIVNTNGQFISKQLADEGINVFYHTVVGDNKQRLLNSIENAASRSDLIIFTGGLGPTKDDLTKETIAEYLGVSLVENKEAMDLIEDYYEKTGQTMSENNRRQALVFDGAEVLPNNNGMAPGIALQQDGKTYILLPGPPKEMQPMFLDYAIPYLKQFGSGEESFIHSRVLRFYGIGESTLETKLIDLIDHQTNPTIAPLAGNFEVTLRLTAKCQSKAEGDELINELENRIFERVGKYFYGYDDTSLANEVMKKLQASDLTLACAESLTGGYYGHDLTKLSGIGQVYLGGIVCYQNEIKRDHLQIPESVLEEQGAVSETCARMMAENIKSLFNSDIGIGFTGVAGPNEMEGKTPGTVFIGIATGAGTKVFPLNLAGSRNAVRSRTVNYGHFYLLDELKQLTQ
ncbi:competence/damage-inducible protein A [Pseudalkalibacillus berkeleyi]|uniref:Putative competence-damage inducible protein n=1 Tax=Pseudalkalibacillus berkeleyi TaxID=1069813 RepID=A0ABS9GWM2_9BACL|nr:competence/damage-inducible protein A [Pseudalkalibacillus berkeleyi]MCF6137179.1 competence/damage-inducible protein A [Pseudalkalibacillus berkeleyi]